MEAPESFGFKLHKPTHFDIIGKDLRKSPWRHLGVFVFQQAGQVRSHRSVLSQVVTRLPQVRLGSGCSTCHSDLRYAVWAVCFADNVWFSLSVCHVAFCVLSTAIYTVPRVPTAPGKPGKTGPDLENLEKQGVWGQKPGKILQNLEKKFDLTLKKPKRLNRKSIWKKINPAQARG